jgi:hypothetical protein
VRDARLIGRRHDIGGSVFPDDPPDDGIGHGDRVNLILVAADQLADPLNFVLTINAHRNIFGPSGEGLDRVRTPTLASPVAPAGG